MDDLGGNEVCSGGNIEELDFDVGGKSGKRSAGDFSTSQKYGKMKRASSSASAGIRDVNCKKRSNSNSAMTKQQKDTAREKDKIRSKSAKVREENRFEAWLAKQPRTAPVEWSTDAPAIKIEGDEGKSFIHFVGQVVTQVKQLGLPNANETRLKHVLDNCFGGTYADYFEKSLMCKFTFDTFCYPYLIAIPSDLSWHAKLIPLSVRLCKNKGRKKESRV